MFLNTLPLAPRPLSLRHDPNGGGFADNGVEYKTLDLVRERGDRIHYLASITIYADGSSPIVMARAHEATDANIKARQMAREYFMEIGANLDYSGAYWCIPA